MKCFAPGDASIVWDSVEDHVVIINLVSGRYFSLNHAASDLWTTLHSNEGLCVDEFHFPDTARFLQEAATSGLLRIAGESSARPELEIWSAGDGPFELVAYNDLEDLLKLDPIHDVDPASGWPTEK